ncbi:hypothetical protein ACTHQF_15620 [Pedobacter sp. SAFR-022]|uniref:hypothetical protein n=1 Tax=Pedobacter sp. SAFR-022 TaxID=3436861 RepID=UPI003F7FF716
MISNVINSATLNFYKEAGIKAIGSRLRMLTDKITDDAAAIYKLYEVDMQPKWFPVFYALSKKARTSLIKSNTNTMM